MPDANDLDLAREFARSNSESAFAVLVQRHINLVYSVALRYVGHTHDAEEVTQVVFIILAKKAGSLREGTILTGWLYETTRFTAAKFMRTKARRQIREREALMQSTQHDSDTGNVWEQLAPILEEGMAQLGEKDRALLALRFFENKSAAETAALLGIREWAAHKRAARGVEKLRMFFARRGIHVSAAVLMAAVLANSVQAAPIGLAAEVVATAAKGAAVGGSILTLTQGALKLMAWTKAKTTIAAGAALLLVGGTATVMVRESAASRTYEAIFATPDSRSMALLEAAPPTLIVRATRYPNQSGGFWSGNGKGVYVNAPLAQLIGIASGFAPTRMILPPTMPAGNYDYLATLPNRQNEALREELKRRFKLTARRETRATDALLLEVKDAARLDGSLTKGGQAACYTTRDGDVEKWIVTNETFSRIVQHLEGSFQKPTLDQTGLFDRYDIRFEWPKASGEERRALSRNAILDQLDRMGLQLVPNLEPVEMLVVEHATD
ncbi:MAG: TIGR03435 family protein [Verrucomicrobiales bacterium]|nr:TIGR03435 family protein [Verrucomicrobiales bacterium]